LNLGVKLTQQETKKKYKGKARAHLSFILDIWYLLVDALEHTVLRVLRLQTLENNSVVKDSTHLVPSLVSGMKYSTHTILHSSSIQEDSRAYQLGFSSRGAPLIEEQFDPAY
jgi:hypothetical protein